MSKMLATMVCLLLFASFAYAGQAYAADEDTQASVYLVFDPETGEFVTVHDPNLTAQHQADAEAIASVADTGAASAAGTSPAPAAGSLPMTWIVAAVLVGLAVIAGFVRLRRGQQRA